MTADCPECERAFSSWAKLRHHHKSKHGQSLPNRECTNCGEEFFSKYEKKYCSDSCRSNSSSRPLEGSNNPNYKGGKETTECEICDDTFEYYSSEKPGHYCSTCVEEESWRSPPEISGEDHPHWEGGKIEVNCAVCDATFERYPSELTGEVTLCSDECQYEWLSEAFAGEGHPNWRGGGNEDYGKGWNEVRKRALERDDHSCVLCGTKEEMGRNPDVHHILPVRTFVASPVLTKRDAHTLDNVVSLCIPCHRRAEFGDVSRRRLRWLAAGGPLHV